MTRPMIHEESDADDPCLSRWRTRSDQCTCGGEAYGDRFGACCASASASTSLQRLMHEHLPRKAPPPGLRMRVETAVGLRRPAARLAHTQFSWRALAASIAVTAFVASGSTSMLLAPSQSNSIRDGIVDAHLRSLMAPQPIDVASSDKHTVKPWFNGRIPQSPRVVDLAKEEFPLVGGRIDVVGEIPVPTLVYGHRKHLISLYGGSGPRARQFGTGAERGHTDTTFIGGPRTGSHTGPSRTSRPRTSTSSPSCSAPRRQNNEVRLRTRPASCGVKRNATSSR